MFPHYFVVLTSEMLIVSPSVANTPDILMYFVKYSKSYISKSVVVPELVTNSSAAWVPVAASTRQRDTKDKRFVNRDETFECKTLHDERTVVIT